MHLTPHEQERLLIRVAADVAQRRKDRGLKLNYPEAVALLTAYVFEEARAGQTVHDIMTSGREQLKREHLMDGVAEMIENVQVEATFPDGTKLVTIHSPIPEAATKPPVVHPGKVDHPNGQPVAFNKGLEVTKLWVHNPTDRPIQVGSHYHFAEANPGLQFDRAAAFGKRLNVPAGTSERFEPEPEPVSKEEPGREVELVPIAGERVVMGLRKEVGGPING
ncbi:urease subunit gamma [Streptomyces sp. NBC_00322]|uniref:urease subunit gamma n=1 Tax=Streptomyces sp. NBC_00322 TaxID=2975712 RepID=UPI002E2A28A2|nr:urease subunit gamma [Streptomyces sp. NBC_00322]